MDEPIDAKHAADYLVAYTRAYQLEHERFVTPPPEGGGYPLISTAPYDAGGTITCYLCPDGYALASEEREPHYQWWIAGGPALLVDTEPTCTPTWVREALEREGLIGKNIGIYRIVPGHPLSIEERTGSLPQPIEKEERSVGGITVVAKRYDLMWRDLAPRLTFGALGPTLDLHLSDSNSPFWEPRKIRNFGFRAGISKPTTVVRASRTLTPRWLGGVGRACDTHPRLRGSSQRFPSRPDDATRRGND